MRWTCSEKFRGHCSPNVYEISRTDPYLGFLSLSGTLSKFQFRLSVPNEELTFWFFERWERKVSSLSRVQVLRSNSERKHTVDLPTSTGHDKGRTSRTLRKNREFLESPTCLAVKALAIDPGELSCSEFERICTLESNNRRMQSLANDYHSLTGALRKRNEINQRIFRLSHSID